MDFIFKLGYNEELALMELSAVTGQAPQKSADHAYQVSLSGPSQMNYLANRLGGTVEVADQSGKRVWRHRAKAWAKRDREKPYYDRRLGLLPPKIARILVNLAIKNTDPKGKVLLDPFCGSGTILMEAGLLGLSLIGNDLDMGQLTGAKRNLNWLGLSAELFNADAVKVSFQIKKPVDFIATEPYMGKLTVRPDRLPDLARGLKKLYLGCLKDWAKILVPGGRVVMVFPVFEFLGKIYQTGSVIDDSHLLDYNIEARGIMYYRPQAKVRREIVILTKK